MRYKTSKQKQDKKHTLSISYQSPVQSTNTKMVIIITVEYILAQGKISTIDIKSLSGND